MEVTDGGGALTVREFAERLQRQLGATTLPGRDIRRCVNCGSRFDGRLNQRRSYCSSRCRHAWHALGRQPQPRLDFGR